MFIDSNFSDNKISSNSRYKNELSVKTAHFFIWEVLECLM